MILIHCTNVIDTGIAEEIMSQTITDEFNRMLEAQQSKWWKAAAVGTFHVTLYPNLLSFL
jgi:hypothetical protein